MAGQPVNEALRSSTRKGIGSRQIKSFTHSYEVGHKRFRIPFLEREKAAYLILRKKGCSYNLIAEAFGRSVSVVYRAIQRATGFRHKFNVWGNRMDIRKLPYRVRMRMASFRRYKMFQLLSQWETWICGEEAEPP